MKIPGVEYEETDRVRMEPDIYDGPNCDQHRPRWIASVPKEGDEEVGTVVELDANHFPPGTQIIITEPICPKCGEVYENCMVRGYGGPGECDFDWKKLAEDHFS